ncbi:MAG: hypothetical protein FRX48_04200 [Lasallia pustulata]|uniref:Uncharacterized protein n=1 Tax=Lasallia pustulata TaxID=136370 RepID=A0A5M8PSU9_9LECA|nr:MAG: hypothetical protein FRX48_04200 [Lasallia pustulata]
MDIGESAIHSLLGLKSPWSRKPPWADGPKGEGVTSRRLSNARSACTCHNESRRSLVPLSVPIEKKPGKGEAAKAIHQREVEKDARRDRDIEETEVSITSKTVSGAAVSDCMLLVGVVSVHTFGQFARSSHHSASSITITTTSITASTTATKMASLLTALLISLLLAIGAWGIFALTNRIRGHFDLLPYSPASPPRPHPHPSPPALPSPRHHRRPPCRHHRRRPLRLHTSPPSARPACFRPSWRPPGSQRRRRDRCGDGDMGDVGGNGILTVGDVWGWDGRIGRLGDAPRR